MLDDVASFHAPADAYDAHIGRYGAALAAALLEVSDIRAGARALDVGCGPGALTVALAARLAGRGCADAALLAAGPARAVGGRRLRALDGPFELSARAWYVTGRR